jgi:uncharacterized membrane protein
VAAQDLGGFTIETFDTELVVESNSDMVVEERIVVNFSAPRRGIFRTIPIRYSDPKGYSYSLDLHLLSATDDAGQAHQTQVTHQGRNVNIRLGDPDRTIEGRMTYVIRYRVRDALSRFGEFDEIYWNATGNEWDATIARASATVRLPAEVMPEQLSASGYTGLFGATTQDVEITYPEPGVVQFRATRPLSEREGLTVAVGFPTGVVTFPSTAKRAGRIALDNWVALLPLAWLGFLLRRYRVHGRDPDTDGSVMVTYEPPHGLTPAAVGTLIDEKVDLADITATVVDLAVRRYLTIRVDTNDRLFGLFKQEETVFVREPSEGRPELAHHERLVMNAIFATGDEVTTDDLTNKFYKHLPSIRKSLYESLADQGYFDGSPDKVRTRWILLGILAGVVTGLVAFGWMVLRGVPPPAVPLVPLVTAGATILAFVGFSNAMPRRTSKGVAARRWALGFQEFASRVERERLEQPGTLEQDPRHEFETLLPYAMALGVAGAWAKKYEGIYATGSPDWYVGNHAVMGFSTQSFERSLSGAMSRTSTTMASSPRSSSGSGGGGSSGGGGGGGGGGSW